jgi:hypothetical protein
MNDINRKELAALREYCSGASVGGSPVGIVVKVRICAVAHARSDVLRQVSVIFGKRMQWNVFNWDA